MVYDQFTNLAAARQTAGIPNVFWVWIFWILTVMMLTCALWLSRPQTAGARKAAGYTGLITVIWVPVAALALVRVYAAYFYQVLHHHCPWCLFLPEHKFVGIPLFGALVIITLEGPISYLAVKTAANYPDLLPRAKVRSRLAALRLFLAAVAYIGMVALPALYSRLLYGIWIG